MTGKRLAGPSSKIQRKQVEGVSLQVYNPPTTQCCHFISFTNKGEELGQTTALRF